VSKQLAQGCYPAEKRQGRDANPGPLGPKARALTNRATELALYAFMHHAANNTRCVGLYYIIRPPVRE